MQLRKLYGISKKYLASLVLLISHSIFDWAHKNILVYAGPGVGPKSLANTVALLQSLVADPYTIKTVDSDTIIGTEWLNDTALLVMPGGADAPYMEKLTGIGNQNIRDYVQNGGKYLGICAGAYYAADRIEFAKDDPRLEVIAARELKFYPGLVEGPTYDGFDYVAPQNINGMRAAMISWQADQPFAVNKKFVAYYNGGGHFVAAEEYPQITVLARYNLDTPSQAADPVAIIECKYGKGTAILSGLHFEWDPQSLADTPLQLAAIKADLLRQNSDRVLLAKHLLTRLGLTVY